MAFISFHGFWRFWREVEIQVGGLRWLALKNDVVIPRHMTPSVHFADVN